MLPETKQRFLDALNIFWSCFIPEEWLKALIIPYFKKGDHSIY
jgi:hypothetical protein